MHRYEELEKRYYKEKIKEGLIFFSGFVVIVTILYAIYSYLSSPQEPKKEQVEHEKVEPKKETIKQEIKKETIKKEPKETQKEIKKPKKEVNKTEKPKVVVKEVYYPIYQSKVVSIPILTYQVDIETNKSSKKTSKEVEKKEINNTKQEIKESKKELNSTEDVKKDVKKIKKIENPKPKIIVEDVNISTLVANFELNPSYDKAITIANFYLNSGDLNKSQKWAIKANSLNPEKYQSWKIFALILIKKKEIKKAKQILNVYLKDYGDNKEIKKLLRSLND